MESTDFWKNRFLAATRSSDAEGHLVREVLNFKRSGGTQKQAEQILGYVWDYNEEACDPEIAKTLEDVDNAITGYCAGSNHLFAADFKEEHYYRKIPPPFDAETQ
jgi:transglutaminase-like putative cysteine protease